jgi:hypothetical protein
MSSLAASSAKSASAGGHELHPWLVKSSTTPTGRAASSAGAMPVRAGNAKANAASVEKKRNVITIQLVIAGRTGFLRVA